MSVTLGFRFALHELVSATIAWPRVSAMSSSSTTCAGHRRSVSQAADDPQIFRDAKYGASLTGCAAQGLWQKCCGDAPKSRASHRQRRQAATPLKPGRRRARRSILSPSPASTCERRKGRGSEAAWWWASSCAVVPIFPPHPAPPRRCAWEGSSLMIFKQAL